MGPRAEDNSPGFARALSLVGAGAGARAVSTVMAAVAAFLTAALLVRLLGTSLYGALAFGMSIVGLAGALILGFGVAISRTLAASLALGELDAAQDVTRGASAVAAVVGVVGFVIVLLAVILTQNQLGQAQALVLGLGLGVLLAGRTAAFSAGAVARGFGRVVLMELPALAGVLFQLGAAVILALMGMASAEAIGAAYCLVGLCVIFISLATSSRVLSGVTEALRPGKAAAVNLLHTAAPFIVAGVAVKLIASFDVFVLGIVHPGEQVGAYAPTLTLIEGLAMLTPMLLMALFVTAASQLVVSGDVDGFARLYLVVSKVSLLIAMPAFLLIAAAPTRVLQAVFGDQFPASSSVTWVLLAGFFVNVALGVNAQALIASGERWRLARAFIWPIVAMVVTSLVLIPWFSALGAATATTIAVVVLNASMSWTLYRATGVHPFHRDMILVVVTSPFVVAGAIILDRAIGEDVWTAAVATLLAWCAWLVTLRLMGAFRFAELRGFVPTRYVA